MRSDGVKELLAQSSLFDSLSIHISICSSVQSFNNQSDGSALSPSLSLSRVSEDDGERPVMRPYIPW